MTPTQIKKVECVWIEWAFLNMDWTFLVKGWMYDVDNKGLSKLF